ncbi:hypothetical protein PG990_006735 [Apiospora arundinis]
MSSQPLMRADLDHFPQRLYSCRLRAMAKATDRLGWTAYTVLNAADQCATLLAVTSEIRAQCRIIMLRLVAREKFRYEAVIEAAITKVFYENLALFNIDGKDESTVEELLHF